MMRSLSSAVAGLRTHQTKMDVIGNNIANVNTYGYKASRAVFQDIYYQNLNRGSSPVTTIGGTNPTQIGYGAAIATIDVLNTRAGAAMTDRPMDVYIAGEGYLTLQDSAGNYMYTRLGSLGFDAAGNLVDGGGNFVMGFPTDVDGNPVISADGTVAGDALRPISVDPALLQQLTDITISEGGEIIGILPGNTRIQMGTAIPSWVGVPQIPEDSNLQGQVELNIGALPSATALSDAILASGGSANAITNVEFGELSLDANSPLEISTTAGGQMTMKAWVVSNDNPPVRSQITAEGQLLNGKIVLNFEGKELMTLTVAPNAAFRDTSGTHPENVLNLPDFLTYVDGDGKTQTAIGLDGKPIPVYNGMTVGGPVTTDGSGKAVQATDANGLPAVYRVDGDPDKAAITINGKEIPVYVPNDPTDVLVIDPLTSAPTQTTTTPGTIQVPNSFEVSGTAVGGLKYLVSTYDKGGNLRTSENALGESAPEDLASLTLNADGQYEVRVGDATFTFGPGMTNFMGNIGRVGMSEGEKLSIGCIAIAKFSNQSGLEQVGDTQYVSSMNTGDVTYNKPGTNNVGALTANMLEQSNVDIAKEFTEMITTQRGFQANTRIVTVSDEMLNELVNLKR